MSTSRLLAVAIGLSTLAASLTGCLATHEERIRVRRDPGIVEQEERRIRPDAYEAWLLQRQAEKERLQLTPALNREQNRYELTDAQIEAVLRGLPEDPFLAYEDDRIDVLHRNWADNHRPPPEANPLVLTETSVEEKIEETFGPELEDAEDEEPAGEDDGWGEPPAEDEWGEPADDVDDGW